MFRRILVLADNYELTDSLLRYIPNVFPSSEYHVLSIIDFGYDILSVTHYVKDTLQESAIRAMLHCVSLLEEAGIDCRKTILKGNFQAVVEKYVRENGIDLIATETYIDEVKKKSHFSWHLEGLFKAIRIPILFMDRPVEEKKPESVCILYSGTGYSEGAANLGMRLAEWLGASCLVLHVGKLGRDQVYPYLEGKAEKIGVRVEIDSHTYSSARELVEIIANYDLFVTSRGGRSWKDRAIMAIKRLPLRKIEIEAIMYAPIPTILVGETSGVSYGY
ncbi:MAG: universal stress protein [Methanomassiliicoccales archaeon]|nr:MAG: universal stress protein [Methanomassiliicoccales archaeon]